MERIIFKCGGCLSNRLNKNCKCRIINIMCNCSTDLFDSYKKNCVSCFYNFVLDCGPDIKNKKLFISYVTYNTKRETIFLDILNHFINKSFEVMIKPYW